MRCKIRCESEGRVPMNQIGNKAEEPGQNWMPVGIALGVVALVFVGPVLTVGRRRAATEMDSAYAQQVRLGSFAMSESSNFAGGKITYLDGTVTNAGTKTLVGTRVRVLFRNAAGEVSQNMSMPLNLIRTREPYIDTEPMAQAPLKPGESREFRLIFDQVTTDWDGQYPQVTVVGAATR